MKHKLIKLIGLILVLLFAMACSALGGGSEEVTVSTDEPAPSVEGGETIEPTEEPPADESGLCANAYYPVVEGGTWSYQGTSSATDDYSFSNTITSVREDGFSVTVQFDDVTLEQEWMCTSEGILALDAGGGPAGTLTTGGINLEIDTQNTSGITYPNEISAGDTWSHTLEYTGTMDMAGEAVEVSGNTVYSYTAIGVESVSVPAGTFDAMKIELSTTINISMNMGGSEVPVVVSSNSTSWYAEGIGWLKLDSTSDVFGVASSDVIELQSYSIP